MKLFFHIQRIVLVLLYRSKNSICQILLYQKLWFPFLNLETRLFGWFFCNVNNTCQQCCVGIQGSQVDFALGFLLSVGKFEMHCLHRDLHKNGILVTTISCFCAQSYTWLCFDPNDQHRPFLRCIF